MKFHFLMLYTSKWTSGLLSFFFFSLIYACTLDYLLIWCCVWVDLSLVVCMCVLLVNEDNAMRMSVLQWVYIGQQTYKLEPPPPMNLYARSLWGSTIRRMVDDVYIYIVVAFELLPVKWEYRRFENVKWKGGRPTVFRRRKKSGRRNEEKKIIMRERWNCPLSPPRPLRYLYTGKERRRTG